jgi:cell division protein FtsN
VTDTDSSFPIVLRRRPRRRVWLLVALASFPIVGVIPALGIAQASRQGPGPAGIAAFDVTDRKPRRHVDRPATVTLGALIEAQRRARAQRLALAATADLPPGEAWQAQLGAFSSADAAERQRARLIEAGVSVTVEQVGSLHRLQSLPAMRVETEGLCARAQASGIDCFVRQASGNI